MYRILALLLALAPPVQAAELLNLKDISEEIIHRAWTYEGTANGQELAGTIVYRRDGKLLILTDQGYSDGGTWQLKHPDRLCTRVRDFRQSAEVCFGIAPLGEDHYATSHGFRLYLTPDKSFEGV